ncbi:hypothetical protein [Paracoccus sp. KR1-242]|uniref:hypothetical protein n=1 Tax=Paracoccus sp. KR1-242 TaxID=3410028 RepID=UPI003C0D8515
MAEEPDLVISAGFSDAKLVQEANRIVAEFRRRGEEAQKAFVDAQARVPSTAVVRAHEREMDRLKRSFDPAYRAAKLYEEEVKRLDRALDGGAITQKQYTANVDRAAAKMRDAGNAVQELGRKGQAGGTGLQNLGFQVGDFATQVGAGTSAAQALGQQLPQLLGGMGTMGALMGAGAAIAIPLGAALLKVAMDTETLDDKLKSLEKTTGAYLDAVETAQTPLDQLRLKYGNLADEIARVNDVTEQMAGVQARVDLIGAANKLGSGSPVPNTVPEGMVGTSWLSFGIPTQPLDQIVDPITQVRTAYKATTEQAERLLQARLRLKTSNSEEAVARDAENLRDVLIDIAGSADAAAKRFPEQIQQLNTLITAAAEQIAAAGRAQRQAQQDLLDTYDANTQKLRKLADDRRMAEESQTEAIKAGKVDQAEAYGRVLTAIDNEVQAVKQSIAEMDGTFEASVKRMQGLAGGLGGTINSAIKNWTGLNLSEWGKTGAASQKGILDLIASRESAGAGDYNAAYGGAKFTGGNLSLVNMSLNEVLAVQKRMLAHPENTANSSALGRYQIVGTTLRGLMSELNLSGDELFDSKMQDRLATQLVRRRLPQGVEGLRNEWEGLRNVPAPLIEQALNQQSIERLDPEIAKDRQKALDQEVKERERLAKQAKEYGLQLSSNLLSQQKQAELAKSQADQIAAIRALDLGEADQARAIAEVTGEIERQRVIYTLLEEAKRRQVDLDALMANGSMTYRQAIEALGEAKKAEIVTTNERALAESRVAESQQFLADAQARVKNGLLESIVAGESFSDVLQNLALMMAKAAAQAALFGEGPMARGGGSGLLGGLLAAVTGFLGGGGDPLVAARRGAGLPARAGGGPVKAGMPYLINENTPRSEVWVPSHSGAVLNVQQAQAALGSRRGTAFSFSPTTHISVQGSADDRTVEKISRELDRRDERLRREMPSIMKNFNLTDG